MWIGLDNIVFISLRVWIEDAVQLLPRLGSSGRTLPTHEEGVQKFYYEKQLKRIIIKGEGTK